MSALICLHFLTSPYSVQVLVVFVLVALTNSLMFSPKAIEQAVSRHNAARAQVDMPPVVWDDAVAQGWGFFFLFFFSHSFADASRYADKCLFNHNRTELGLLREGENLFMASWGGNDADMIAAAIAAWLSERGFYDVPTGRCSGGECHHWTQM